MADRQEHRPCPSFRHCRQRPYPRSHATLASSASDLWSLGTAGYARIRPLPVSVAGRSASVSSAVPAVGSWSPFLHSIKASIIGSTPLSPQRSARRPDRVRPRPDRPDRAAGARRTASVVRDSMLRIRCMTTVLSVTCRTTPRSWGRTGGHSSAGPGLGMNRAPGRLYLAVWLSCVRVGCGLAGNDVVCFP
jgi:hypothetical protein